jgi:hypothetical protein
MVIIEVDTGEAFKARPIVFRASSPAIAMVQDRSRERAIATVPQSGRLRTG